MHQPTERRDPYHHQEIWQRWIDRHQKKAIPGVSSHNAKLILHYLEDMEMGKNVAPGSRKGERSFIRLNALRHRMIFFARHWKSIKLDELTKDHVHRFFLKLRRGQITRQDGKPFRGVGTLVKDFKAFWHYLMRTGHAKADITSDLSRADEKPPWVYLTEEQFKLLANRCNPEYRPLVWFLYDSMARVTEAYSIKVRDFSENYSMLQIRPETAKTFGRKFKLKLCSALIADYVNSRHLQSDDFLFQKTPAAFNKYLKRLSGSLFGAGQSPARGRFCDFTLYDIRHNSTCFWLMRYPARKGVMYRGGWTKEEQLNYYGEFLGLSDQLTDEDMVTAEAKTRMEREIAALKQKLTITTAISQLQLKRSLGKISEPTFLAEMEHLQRDLERTLGPEALAS